MELRGGPNLRRRVVVMAALAGVMILVLLSYQIWQGYRATVENGRRDLQQLTQVLLASADATFQSAAIIVEHAITEVQDRPGSPVNVATLNERFAAIAEGWDFVNSIAFVGADGMTTAGVTRAPDGRLRSVMLGTDLSKSQIFILHRDADAQNRQLLYISKPVPAATSGRMVIAVSKAVRDADGAFEGICVITVGLDTFERLFAGFLPSHSRAAGLLRSDGTLMLSTEADAKTGESYADTNLFKKMIPNGREAAYRFDQAADHRDRLVAYSVSQIYPIVVVANADWGQMLAEWRHNALLFAGLTVAGLIVIAALAQWLARQIAAEQTIKFALMKSEKSLGESQRLGGIAHFERDLVTNEQVWGDNMFAVHGVDPRTFAPSREAYIGLVVSADRDKVRRAWGEADQQVPTGNLECRIKLPDGGLRHIRYSWRYVSDGAATPTRLFGVAQDVTAIRDAENTIRDDEQRLRDIVECSSDYIWECDAGGCMTFFAGSGAEKFGKIVGQRPRLLSTVRVDEGDAAQARAAMASRRSFRNILLPLVDRDGNQHWLRSSANPRFDHHGAFLGYRGMATDVTEILRRQERDEDDRRAEALGRLASGLAHEINNLLQPIMIYASFGTSRADISGEVHRYFSHIGRAAERASLIVKNVLAFARRSQPNLEDVNPRDVVRETVEFISGTLAPGTQIVVTDAVSDLLVRADRTGLGQVLTNLLSNAAEALPLGGRIAVSTAIVHVGAESAQSLALRPGAYCHVSVEDNGAGIAPQHLARVFEPFFTTKPQGKGTGLGLSVVAGLVKSWGGGVAAESAEGYRTCFSVYLPLAEREMQAAQ